mmetsp:Transcript_62292/g.175617  ORF Transcript_62292/g.175617 Transcript_62292/m.175617 type:complete len:508 (-) Transcript_62292:641-2164(-)
MYRGEKTAPHPAAPGGDWSPSLSLDFTRSRTAWSLTQRSELARISATQVLRRTKQGPWVVRMSSDLRIRSATGSLTLCGGTLKVLVRTFVCFWACSWRSVRDSKIGKQTKSKKPFCDLPKSPAWLRSQRAEMGSPRLRSSSPCWKNSSMIRTDHVSWSSQFSAACPMSAAFMHMLEMKCRSDMFPTARSPLDSLTLNFDSISKCSATSVARIYSIISERMADRSDLFKPSNMSLPLTDCITSRHVAACMFSRTLELLYRTARACSVLTQNALLRPKCPTSWASAAIAKAAHSMSDWLSATPKCRISQVDKWQTWAACTPLWYGLLWYSDAIFAMKAVTVAAELRRAALQTGARTKQPYLSRRRPDVMSFSLKKSKFHSFSLASSMLPRNDALVLMPCIISLSSMDEVLYFHSRSLWKVALRVFVNSSWMNSATPLLHCPPLGMMSSTCPAPSSGDGTLAEPMPRAAARLFHSRILRVVSSSSALSPRNPTSGRPRLPWSTCWASWRA